jgi:hypothetical protein
MKSVGGLYVYGTDCCAFSPYFYDYGEISHSFFTFHDAVINADKVMDY